MSKGFGRLRVLDFSVSWSRFDLILECAISCKTSLNESVSQLSKPRSLFKKFM